MAGYGAFRLGVFGLLFLLRVKRVRAFCALPLRRGLARSGHGPRVQRAWERLSPVRRATRVLAKWATACINLVGLSFLVLVLGAEAIDPLTAPRAVLTDGSRTVVFEGMVHVGTPAYYDRVREDIRAEKAAGASYYYELVRRSADPAREAAFTARVMPRGFPDGVDRHALYGAVATLTGAVLQPQGSFTTPGDPRDVNADVSVDDLWDRLRPKEQAADRKMTAEDLRGVLDAVDALGRQPDWVQRAVHYVARSVVRVLLATPEGDRSAPDAPAILDYRNEVLADMISAGPARIVVTYGAGHLPGLLEALRRRDPRWHVEGVAEERRVFE